MIEKEIAELRRRLRPDRHSITHIYGCYVSDSGEIISCFAQSPGLMPEDEAEKYFAFFRRTLTGTIQRNLLDISFTTAQVADSDEHRLLMELRSNTDDEAVRRKFFEKVIESKPMEGNYLILLIHNSYDVPFKGKSGGLDADGSETVFSYIQCALCPVKLTKSVLAYRAAEETFRNTEPALVASSPELGFLFPAFDDRATNLYDALFYTRDLADGHDSFLDAIFRCEPPMPADEQQSTFRSVMQTALADDCSYEAVREVHTQLRQMIQAHKESREPETLTVSGHEVGQILQSAGISKEKGDAFSEQFDEQFGGSADLVPANILDTKKFEVVTPEITIRVDPEHTDLLETRILGGVRYLLIRADESVEVNGVPIRIPEKE